MSEANIAGAASSQTPHLRRALWTWVILSIVGIAVWLLVEQYIIPPSESALGADDNFTLVMLMVLSIPVSLFVFVFLGYSIFAFKSLGRPADDEIGEYIQPRPGLQIGWLGITSVLCLFLLIWGMFAFYQETSAVTSSDTLVVNVTAQQWLWTFDYPQYGATSQGAQVIYLPVNRPVIFHVTSKDVLHGFAVRALGVRVDANPGETTSTSVTTPTEMGVDAVQCVELCGLYHTYMWEEIHVVSVDDFNAWITSQGGHI